MQEGGVRDFDSSLYMQGAEGGTRAVGEQAGRILHTTAAALKQQPQPGLCPSRVLCRFVMCGLTGKSPR